VKAREGSIAVLAALSLVSVIGMSSLAVELGNGFAAKVRNQRVADMAALGAAVAFKTSQSLSVASSTASDIVAANGLTVSPADLSVTKVTVGTTEGIRVALTTAVPIKLASVLTRAASYNVTSAAVASLIPVPATGCISALGDSSTAIYADGGAGINASGCSVVTNGTIYSTNSSAKITAKQIGAAAINDVAAKWSQDAVTTTPTARNWTLAPGQATDFVKPNADVQTALCYVNKLTGKSDTYDAVSNPNGYAGGNTDCTNLLVKTDDLPSNGSTEDWTSDYKKAGTTGFSKYKVTGCTYKVTDYVIIRDLTIGGGCTVSFEAGGSFRNLKMSGSSLVFKDGDVSISGTFTVNADTTVTIGNGNHSFGSIAIGGGKSLSVGSGNFYLVKSLNLSGGAWITVGISGGDTVTIGHDASNNAIVVGGGSKVCFTSDCTMATAPAGTFSADGSINVAGGGSLVVFPQSQYHIINGDLIATAGVLFGKGLYVIKGDFKNTTGSGSDSMNGTDVTFALGGVINFAGGSKFDLAAAKDAGGYGIQDMLFLTKSTATMNLSAGAVGKASGMIYAPNSAFTSSGGSAISNNGSACMMLLVKTVSVTGSGTVNTAGCSSQSAGSSSSLKVTLIQ